MQPRNKTISVFKINKTKPPKIANIVRRLKNIVEEMMQHTKLNAAIVNNTGFRETDKIALRTNVMKERMKTEGRNPRIKANAGNLFISTDSTGWV